MRMRPGTRVGAVPFVLLFLLPPPAGAQTDAPRRARWTVGLELGAQLPATIYDERVIARLDAEQFRVSTSYRETLDLAPIVRGTLRFRPEAGFGLYLAGQWGRSGTTAQYSGGEEPIETISRDATFWGMEAGVSVRLGSWGDRGGGIGYTIGPALIHHSLDLSAGHRDAFAWVGDFGPSSDFTWRDRSWRSWAFGLGASARLPVDDRWSLRISAQDYVIAVGTSELESQDRQDVRRMTGRAPVFLYSSYTAHYLAVRGGVEYVLAWEPPPPAAPRIALPSRRSGREEGRTPPAVMASRRLLAEGDTATALATLRERVEEDPTEAGSWRELALILTAVAERRPDLRDETWNVLQRALNLNPGDSSLLTAYGRIQALMRRAGAQPPRMAPLALSAVSARGDAAGGVSVGFALRGLSGAAGQPARYRIEVEVVDVLGERVPLRLAEAEEHAAAERLTLTRETDPAATVSELLELRLERVRTGPHSIRVWVTDLGSGQTVEGSAGFEIR